MTDVVMTVLGPVRPSDLGLVLPHEHVMSIFGAPPADDPGYDADRVAAAAVPYLRKVRELGCGTLAECTTERFGRDPALLARISRESGLHILTNTGCYAAAQDRYVASHALVEDAPALAARWIEEWRNGAGATGIRPGFIKIGVDDGPLSELDRKVVRAAALAHLATGLLIQNHLGNNPGVARQILDLLDREGVETSAWVWVHAHAVTDLDALRAAAERGAWLSFDGLSAQSAERHLALLDAARGWGRLEQVLLSHDGEAFDRTGGSRPFDYLLTGFLSRVPEARLITVENPARAFAVKG